jgi:hypothetical protein
MVPAEHEDPGTSSSPIQTRVCIDTASLAPAVVSCRALLGAESALECRAYARFDVAEPRRGTLVLLRADPLRHDPVASAPVERETVHASWEASSRRLRAWFERRTGSAHDADDLVHESSLRVQSKLAILRTVELGAARGWTSRASSPSRRAAPVVCGARALGPARAPRGLLRGRWRLSGPGGIPTVTS